MITSSEKGLPFSSRVGDHGLDEVGRLLRPLRLGLQTGAGLGQQSVEPGPHVDKGAIEPPVRWRLNVTPGGNEGEKPTVDRRQDHFEFALDDVVLLLDRVGVMAEDDQHGDVDREALELLDHVERFAGARRPLPPRLQPHGDDLDARKEPMQVALSEGGDGKLALWAPDLTLGVEHALDPEFAEDAVQILGAAKGFGSRAQNVFDRRRIGRRNNSSRAHPELVDRAVSSRPFLQNEVSFGRVELVKVADQRQWLRARQVIQRARRSGPGSGRLEARDVDEQRAIPLGDGTGSQTFRPSVALSGVECESPAMVSADKRVAVEFALAEQRALMRAAASEGAPSAAGSRQDDVHAVRGQRERTCAFEFAEIGDTNECFGLHDQSLTGRGLGRCSSLQLSPAGCASSLSRPIGVSVWDDLKLQSLGFDERHYEVDSNHVLHIDPDPSPHERSPRAWSDAASDQAAARPHRRLRATDAHLHPR